MVLHLCTQLYIFKLRGDRIKVVKIVRLKRAANQFKVVKYSPVQIMRYEFLLEATYPIAIVANI